MFDTGWAGTFPAFCREMGEKGIPVQDISCILISHFHPDHCGIAQEIADLGAEIAVMDVQKEFIHAADAIFQREPGKRFHPIDDLNQTAAGSGADEREYALVKRIMKYTDKGYSAEKIQKKTGASITIL